MQQAFPSIPQEIKERLHKNGYEKWEPQPLSSWINPHSGQCIPIYWLTNFVLMGAAAYGRTLATKHNSLRIFWGTVFVGVPFFALVSTAKLDRLDDFLGKRKTLEERLEFSPVTRRAWYRAIEENEKYQNELKTEIAQLESKLREKNRE